MNPLTGNRSRRTAREGIVADNLTAANAAGWTRGLTPTEERILERAQTELHKLNVDLPPIRSTEQIEEEQFLAWQAWQEKLTPDELVELKRLCLIAPEPPRKGKRARYVEEDDEKPSVGTCDHLPSSYDDPAQAMIAKERAAGIDVDVDEKPQGRFVISQETKRDLVVLSVVLAEIIDAKNPRLMASILALAIGIGARQMIDAESLAKRHNVGLSWLERRIRDWQKRLDICRVSMALLRRVMSLILASRNPRLEAETIAMAARFGLSGGASMTLIGENHGVCKAAVSARVRRWVKRLGLPLPRECKEQTSNYLLFNVTKQKTKAFSE